jgi:hypothetical protein
MAIADDAGDKYCQSAGILVKFSAISAQIIMTRANRFKLGIDASGYPYVSYYNNGHTWTTATSSVALTTGVWYELSMVAGNGFLYLYVDRERKAGVTGFYAHADPASGNLVVALTGASYSTFFLFGDSTDGSAYLSGSVSGIWEKTVALGARQTLRKVIVDSAIGGEHSGTIMFSFADAEADLDFEPYLTFSLQDEAAWTYWHPERNLKAGTYVRIRVQLSAKSWDRSVPIVDYVTATFRDCVVAVYDSDGMTEAPAYEKVLPIAEQPLPEDLSGLIAEILRQREQLTELERSTAAGIGGVSDAVSDLAQRIGAYISIPDMGMGVPGYRLYYTDVAKLCEQLGERLQIQESQLFGVASLIPPLMNRVGTLEDTMFTAADLAAELEDGGDIDVAVDALIATHAALQTGVHGVSDGSAIASLNSVDSAITGACSAPGETVYDHVTTRIGTHAGDSGDPHSAAGYLQSGDMGGYATDAEVTAAVSQHNLSPSAHSTMNWVDSTEATTIAAGEVSDHDSASGAHSARDWQSGSEVDSAIAANITGHENDCGNYTG